MILRSSDPFQSIWGGSRVLVRSCHITGAWHGIKEPFHRTVTGLDGKIVSRQNLIEIETEIFTIRDSSLHKTRHTRMLSISPVNPLHKIQQGPQGTARAAGRSCDLVACAHKSVKSRGLRIINENHSNNKHITCYMTVVS